MSYSDKLVKAWTEKRYKDFCPLCGSRFYGDTPEEVYNQIIKHCEDGTCEKNFRSLDIALTDEGD